MKDTKDVEELEITLIQMVESGNLVSDDYDLLSKYLQKVKYDFSATTKPAAPN